jgi:hypothetical protein
MVKEQSLSKGHPISTLEQVRDHYRSLGLKIQIRFRGPRRSRRSYHCLKQDAHSFAVYPRA